MVRKRGLWSKIWWLTLVFSLVFCFSNVNSLFCSLFCCQNNPSCPQNTIVQQDDEFEENDSYNNPSYIDVGEYFNLHCLDDDWFIVNIPAQGNIKVANLKVTIQFDNGSDFDKNLDLLLYPVTDTEPNYKKDRLDNSELLGNKEVVSASVPPGSYLIHVFGPFGAKNDYDLKVEILYPCQEAPYNWIDINESEPAVRMEDIDDDDYETIAVGFDFCFYGQYYNSVKVSSNGYLTFSNDATSPNPIEASDKYAPANSIFPYWIDLRPDQGGDIFHKLDQSDPNNERLIVEWRNVSIDACPGEITFQVVLFSGTNRLLFQYMDLEFCDPNDGNSFGKGATVGINNERKTKYADRLATQFSYKEESLNNQSAIIFTPSLEAIPVIPPVVIDTTPEAWETDVALDTEIIIIFDQIMDPDILNTCFIDPNPNGTWNIETVAGQTKLSFKPQGELDPNTTHTVTIAGSATSLHYGIGLDGNENGNPEGTPLDDFSFQLTTAAAPVYETDPPVITILGANDGNFYNDSVDIQIHVSDQNPDPNGLSITLNGCNIFTESFNVSEDGYHTLSVTVYDIFQNVSTASISFTIDQTPPDIASKGCVCGALYNVNVTPIITPVITVTDSNLDVSSLVIELNGASYANGQAISEPNDYELYVYAIDYSGNESSQTCLFGLKDPQPQDGWTSFWLDANCQGSPIVSAIASKIDENGNLWIGYQPYDDGTGIVGGGVCAYNLYSGTCECFDETDGLSGNTITDIVIGAQGDLWVVSGPDIIDGHGAGVSRYIGDGQFNPYGLNQIGMDEDDLALITDIAVDSEGYLWLATAYLGLFRFDGNNADNYSVGIFDCITDIMEDAQGRLWIGTCWDGLFIKDSDNPDWNSSPVAGADWTGAYISGLTTDINENVWMVSEYELMRLEPDQFVPVIPDDFPVNLINSFIIDHNTYYLFVESGQGIYVYNGQVWTPFSLDNSGILASEVNTILVDPYGDYWVWSDTGLRHLNSNPPELIDINGQAEEKTNLPTGTNIFVEFSEPMNEKSVEDAFQMKDMVKWDTVQGSFIWNSASTVMTFVPENGLAYNTDYEITISKTVKDRYGMSNGTDIPSFQISTRSKPEQSQKPAQTFTWPYFTGYNNWNLPYFNIFGSSTPFTGSSLPYFLPQTDITTRYIQQGTGYYSYTPQAAAPLNYQYNLFPNYDKIYLNFLQSKFYEGFGTNYPFSTPSISSNIYGVQWDSWGKFLFSPEAYPSIDRDIPFYLW